MSAVRSSSDALENTQSSGQRSRGIGGRRGARLSPLESQPRARSQSPAGASAPLPASPLAPALGAWRRTPTAPAEASGISLGSSQECLLPFTSANRFTSATLLRGY